MTPHRIQLSRRKGWRKPPAAVVVARPRRWGNPHVVGRRCTPCLGSTHPDRAHAVEAFREYLRLNPRIVAEVRRELAGRDLACWCPLNEPCHADVLLAVANEGIPQ